MKEKIILHPELRARGRLLKLAAMPQREGALKLIYRLTTLMRGKHGRTLKYEQVFIQRGDGSSLRICVYSPVKPKTGAPSLLWIHGGGYSIGVPEQDEKAYITRFIDAGAGCVVAPDYTKSVVAPYPAALNDCYAALKWLRACGEDYGTRPDQIFIGGDSAGGGLTAALSLYARDKGEVAVAFQMPLYPMIDDRPTKSNTGNRAPLWNSKANDLAWRLYLGPLHGSDRIPCYAAPARAADYSGLPPTCTFVGTVEPFFDETMTYVENLRKAGVAVHFKAFPGCFHAFDMVCPQAGVSKEASALMMSAFDFAMKNYFAPQPPL